MRRSLLLLAIFAAVLLLASCRVDTTVTVDVAEDGSGTVVVVVELDREAAQQLGDPATAVRLDDLRQAGWAVDEPATAEDGTLTYRATRPFASPEDLPRVLGEVGGGDGGPDSTGTFRDVSLQVQDAFAGTDYEFSTDVELTGSLEQFSDEGLTSALGGLPLARTPEELTALGADDPETASLSLRVRLPGGTSTSNGTIDDGTAAWSFPVTGGAATSETATAGSSVSQRTPVVVMAVGGLLVVLGLVAAGVALLRRR